MNFPLAGNMRLTPVTRMGLQGMQILTETDPESIMSFGLGTRGKRRALPLELAVRLESDQER